jgi:hypothetical protein
MGLLILGIGVSGLVVGTTQHSPDVRETLPVCVTVCDALYISMWSDSPLHKVWLNKVGIRKMRCRGTTVG